MSEQLCCGEPVRILITDDPYFTGMLDGTKAVRENSRVSRERYLPEHQRADYRAGFRIGAKIA